MADEPPEYEKGKTYPMPPKPKLKIGPMRWSEDFPYEVKVLLDPGRSKKNRRR